MRTRQIPPVLQKSDTLEVLDRSGAATSATEELQVAEHFEADEEPHAAEAATSAGLHLPAQKTSSRPTTRQSSPYSSPASKRTCPSTQSATSSRPSARSSLSSARTGRIAPSSTMRRGKLPRLRRPAVRVGSSSMVVRCGSGGASPGLLALWMLTRGRSLVERAERLYVRCRLLLPLLRRKLKPRWRRRLNRRCCRLRARRITGTPVRLAKDNRLHDASSGTSILLSEGVREDCDLLTVPRRLNSSSFIQ